MNDETIKSKITSNNDRINIISKYVQTNVLAFQYLRNKNYNSAKKSFKECIKISKLLNDIDELKHIESLTNYGICQFFCGKFSDAYLTLESAYQISNRLYVNNFDKHITNLHLRVLSNLCLISLSLNKIPECRNYFDSAILLIKNNRINNHERVLLFRDLIYFLFRLDSVSNYIEQENLEIKLDNIDKEQNYQKMISKTLLSLHKFLKEKDVDGWIKSLTDNTNNKQDSNSQFFTYINLYAAEYYKNGSLTEEQRNKFNNKIKSYADHYKIKLKDKPDKILLEMKNKIEMAMEIYKKIIELEGEFNNISNEQNNNDDKSNKILIKILLKHALNYLEKENNDSELKSQIEMALDLINNNEYDCSSINIFSINSEIIRSLKLLIDNLRIIPDRAFMRINFKKLLRNTLGFETAEEYRNDKYERNQIFYFKKKMEYICEGNTIIKFHYSSSGKSNYFYHVNNDEESLIVYKNMDAKLKQKSSKKYLFSDIKQIQYGINSNNLKKKYKNLANTNFKNPWLYLSLILENRSIDWYFDDEDILKNWFYGLLYFKKTHMLNTDIISVSGFILKKLKLKLISKLKDIAENDDKDPNKSILVLTQLKNYANNNNYGFYNLSFLKIFLLYKKIIKTKQNQDL